MRRVTLVGLLLSWLWQVLSYFLIGFDRDYSTFHFDGTGVLANGILSILAIGLVLRSRNPSERGVLIGLLICVLLVLTAYFLIWPQYQSLAEQAFAAPTDDSGPWADDLKNSSHVLGCSVFSLSLLLVQVVVLSLKIRSEKRVSVSV